MVFFISLSQRSFFCVFLNKGDFYFADFSAFIGGFPTKTKLNLNLWIQGLFNSKGLCEVPQELLGHGGSVVNVS